MHIENGILYHVDFDDINSDGTFIVPDGITEIGSMAFLLRQELTEVTIPNSVKAIGNRAFFDCCNLKKVILPDSIKYIGDNAFEGCYKLKSPKNIYKAFNSDMTCRNYQFEMNEWSKKEKYISLCVNGYHYCTNLFEIFNYYHGDLDDRIVICLCKKGHKTKKSSSSKCVTNKVKPIRRLTRKEIIKILNGEEI